MFWKRKRQHVVDNNGNIISRHNSSVDDLIRPRKKSKKILLMILAFIIIGVISIGLWVGSGAISAVGKIITKNQGDASPFLSFLGNIQPNQLKGEGDGRINILLLGIGGANHPGGQLADTTMVVSIDPKNAQIAMLSIPRDLYVPIPGFGNGKINSAHSTGEQNKDKTGGGPELMKKTVANILDLSIHYYIRADFTGFIKLIDALGGVQVDVEKTISDPFYPDENMEGYNPFYIGSGIHQLDGATALKYARSRETTSDFDRARRQQQILTAVKEKALSAGILTNPKKITDILKILGDHIRTDMQTKEMEQLMTILKNCDTSKIVNKVLDNSSSGLLSNPTTDMGGYYLIPKAGINNFSEIQRLAHEIFSDPYLKEESAKIEILNASKYPGVAKELSATLNSYGYNVVRIADSDQPKDESVIYDYSSGKKAFTLQFLSNRLMAKVISQPKKSSSDIDISIVIGNNYKSGL